MRTGPARRWLAAGAVMLCAWAVVMVGGEAKARTDPRIGRAEKVVMDVRAVMPEAERRLVVNEDVFRDDVIRTEARSATRLVFHDETYLSIGPESRVRLANLPIARDDGEPFVVDAAKGVFKFVSGRLRSDRYQLKTPAATIGVRGTIVWMTVRADGMTEVASQNGEVTVCAGGDCVTLQPGQYSRAEPGRVPTPPAEVPQDFYAQIRDMLIRLLMASDEFGLGFSGSGGGTGSIGQAGAAGGSARGGKSLAIGGLGQAGRGGGGNQVQPQVLPKPVQPEPVEPQTPRPGKPVQVDGPDTVVMLVVGLMGLALVLQVHARPAARVGRRRG